MRRVHILFLVTAMLVVAMFGLMQMAQGQEPAGSIRPQAAGSETQGDNLREVQVPDGVAPDAPLISFIDSPTASCIHPDPVQDACYINWYYMSVSADPNYIITMTAALNTYGPVAYYSGFFQTSMYVPYNLNGQGFKVPCGAQGAGGNPGFGNAYAWTIRARDSAGLKSANYGTTYCPAYIP
jgi:hypothetical protein